MNSETVQKTITLPKTGHTAILKEWLTIKEERQIIRAAMEMGDKENESGVVKHDAFVDFQKKEIEVCVISLNGDGENIWTRLEEYPAQDFKALTDAIKATRGESEEKKSA